VSDNQMQFVIDHCGTITCMYGEVLDLSELGEPTIRRASSVEPDEHGQWWADLSAVQGPRLGPFALRSLALAAEQRWLDRHLIAPGSPSHE
jgi:hypothetical protein